MISHAAFYSKKNAKLYFWKIHINIDIPKVQRVLQPLGGLYLWFESRLCALGVNCYVKVNLNFEMHFCNRDGFFKCVPQFFFTLDGFSNWRSHIKREKNLFSYIDEIIPCKDMLILNILFQGIIELNPNTNKSMNV